MSVYLDGDDACNVKFLFEIEKWNGQLIEKMESSHIVNTILMLLRKSSKFKLDYELFIIDHTNDKLLIPIDNIEDIAKMDNETWIKTTPIFLALTRELAKRRLLPYLDVVLDRYSKNEIWYEK